MMAPAVRLLVPVVAGGLSLILLGISVASPAGRSLLLAVRPARRAGSAAAQGASGDGADQRPPAVALFAPHKTGSTFFVSFLNDMSEQLGACLFTENAAFLYSPRDRTRCSSPACGHPPKPSERRYPAGDSGWGECTSFTDDRLRQAAACMADGPCSVRSAIRGVVWGPIRLPPAMRSAARHAAEARWDWSLVLHQRHPLDTLVSEFHSFGWIHPPAPEATPRQRREHHRRQERIRNVSADAYVSTRLPGLRDRYAPYLELLRQPPAGVRLVRSRYEDMVLFFPQWLSQLLAQLGCASVDVEAMREHLLQMHQAAFVSDGKHKRGVRPGAHLQELRPATIVDAYLAHATWMGELGYI